MSSSKDEIMEIMWNSSNSLRGLRGFRSARNHFLGLVLLKKTSEDPSNKVIDWGDLEASVSEIGKKLNEAFARFEQKYPHTKGWFTELNFDSDEIGGREFKGRVVRDNLWKSIISDLSKINLTLFEKSNPGELCDLILEINERFSVSEGTKGSFETPKGIIRLLSELLSIKEGSTIYDPLCSSGTTLIGSACLQREVNPNVKVSLYGQTQNPQNLLTLYLNLSLVGANEVQIVTGDIIRNPGFYEGQYVKTFQKILSTIPSGMKSWGEEVVKRGDQRFIYGVPPRTQGEFGYLQHCIASLSEDGVLVVVIPPGMLFRERSEGEIRRGIISDDIIEAVISLPPKLYIQTSIQFSVLVINRKKAEARKEKILFINAANDYLQGRSQNRLRNEDVNKIVTFFKEFKNVEGYSLVCSLDEIAKNNYQLEVSQYIKQKKEIEPQLDLDVMIKELDSIHSEKNAAYDKMQISLRKIMGLQEVD